MDSLSYLSAGAFTAPLNAQNLIDNALSTQTQPDWLGGTMGVMSDLGQQALSALHPSVGAMTLGHPAAQSLASFASGDAAMGFSYGATATSSTLSVGSGLANMSGVSNAATRAAGRAGWAGVAATITASVMTNYAEPYFQSRANAAESAELAEVLNRVNADAQRYRDAFNAQSPSFSAGCCQRYVDNGEVTWNFDQGLDSFYDNNQGYPFNL